MIKSHAYSPNHKVVSKSPHTFDMLGRAPKTAPVNGPTGGGSAEPAGGGAQGPAPEMFCNGGKAYADGGYTKAPGMVQNAVDSVKQVASDWKDKLSKPKIPNPISTDNDDQAYEGIGGKMRQDTVDQAVKNSGG